jgi:uncharacterized membrane protein YfcA
MVALYLVAVAAFATEGVLGFGATLLVASIGSQLVPLAELLPAAVAVNLALSGWIVARDGARADRRALRELAAPLAIGAVLGIATSHVVHAAWLARAFAVLVIALAVSALVRRAPAGARRGLLVLAGLAHGMFGTGGPLVVHAVGGTIPDPRTFRATLAIVWSVLGAALVASYAMTGSYSARTTMLMAAALPPGLVLGELLHRRLAPARFARAVWLVLLAAGLAQLVQHH